MAALKEVGQKKTRVAERNHPVNIKVYHLFWANSIATERILTPNVLEAEALKPAPARIAMNKTYKETCFNSGREDSTTTHEKPANQVNGQD